MKLAGAQGTSPLQPEAERGVDGPGAQPDSKGPDYVGWELRLHNFIEDVLAANPKKLGGPGLFRRLFSPSKRVSIVPSKISNRVSVSDQALQISRDSPDEFRLLRGLLEQPRKKLTSDSELSIICYVSVHGRNEGEGPYLPLVQYSQSSAPRS